MTKFHTSRISQLIIQQKATSNKDWIKTVVTGKIKCTKTDDILQGKFRI